MNLHNIRGICKNNYNLSHLTWFKVGGCADLFFKPIDLDDLVTFITQNHKSALQMIVIGAGSNIIIRDSGIAGVVIKLGGYFTNITLNDDHIVVGAGCLNFNLAKFCQINSIQGLEFLVGIPGTIGGGIIMNAGAYGFEFKDILLSVEAVDNAGNVMQINAQDICFEYRKSNLPPNLIITKGIFARKMGNKDDIARLMNEISSARLATQPIKERTGGSTFANPKNNVAAWKLIDQSGLRGHSIGGASISNLHCNFMINNGTASANDLETLGEFVKGTVLAKTGVTLEWEIKRIGRK